MIAPTRSIGPPPKLADFVESVRLPAGVGHWEVLTGWNRRGLLRIAPDPVPGMAVVVLTDKGRAAVNGGAK